MGRSPRADGDAPQRFAERSSSWLRRVYAGSMVRVFDDVMLVVMIVVVAATTWSGLHVLSFTSGLLVGMTLIQIFFHRFDQPLTEEWAPAAPVTPLKLMAYAIQS